MGHAYILSFHTSQISVGSRNYTAKDDSFLFVTPSPPPEAPRFKLPIYLIVMISVSIAVGLCLFLLFMLFCYKTVGKYKNRKDARVKVAPFKVSPLDECELK